MKKIVFLFAFLFVSSLVIAQERYLDPIFTSSPATTVTYSSVSNFQMDIYEPVGDTQAQRPLIIFAHGGAFIAGSKTNPTMVQACEYFAERGYVTASIQYTLSNNIFSLLDSLAIIDVVMKAVADGKAAVRYMRQDAATSNQYRIDPNKIFFGGSSAGAVLGLHLAHIDENDILPAHLQTIVDQNGGLEGDKGNDGYSSEVIGVLNWAGGINKLSFLNQASPPTFSGHGTNDGTVPYNCDDVFSGNPLVSAFDLVDLCGSGEIFPYLDNLGVNTELYAINGADHVPWESDTAIRNELFNRSAAFLYKYAKCINIKALFEGYVDVSSGLMNTTLLNDNLLPITQPYAASPYFMTSNTTIIDRFPENTVDWVLLEVRDANNTTNTLERQTLFIRNDGMLMNIDGTTDINFTTTGTHHIALFHKGHLGIISANPIDLEGDGILLDFSAGVNQARGIQQQKDLGGLATMYCGDYDGNGVINNNDFNKWAVQSATVNQYMTWDGDGNGVSNAQDFNLWTNNRSKIGDLDIQF